jgi:SRSO17 transposase
MTKKGEQALLIFERKIFRRIYGAKYENGEWKSGTNRELEEMSRGENIVGAKEKLARREWRRTGCLKRSLPKNWRG